jgi:hypothetical protein
VSWLSIIGGVLSFVQWLTGYLHERQIIDSATKDVMLKNARESLDAIEKANKARELVRAAAARDPAGIVSDDGFERND